MKTISISALSGHMQQLFHADDSQGDFKWLFPAPWAWALLALLGLVVTAWLALGPLDIDPDSDLYETLAVSGVLLALGLVNAWRGSARLGILLQGLAFFILLGVLGRALNYLVTSLAMPERDDMFAAFHRLIGFDWKAHVLWLDSHPLLVAPLEFAYFSFSWMIPLTVIGFIVLGRYARVREFLLLFAMTGVVCVLIGGMLPAQAAFVYYNLSPAGLEHIPPSGVIHLADYSALRAGTFTNFDISTAEGLVTFPSFHTVMALLFAWAWRGTWLQWPVWLLAGLTIAATPAIGGHYLIDLAGGAAVFWGMVRLLRWLDALQNPAPAASATRLRQGGMVPGGSAVNVG